MMLFKFLILYSNCSWRAPADVKVGNVQHVRNYVAEEVAAEGDEAVLATADHGV